MTAPEGNQFWKLRGSHGRKPTFDDPEQLWGAACEYFEWVEANPLREMKAFAYQGDVTQHELPKMRAMTIGGLCLHLDISKSTWAGYREREGFEEVVERVDEVIRTQKFEGAAADLLNPNIIWRDLGLVEKVSADVSPAERRGDDDVPLYDRMRAYSFGLYSTIRKAHEAGDAKALKEAFGWLSECVTALKGRDHFGNNLANRKEATNGQTSTKKN